MRVAWSPLRIRTYLSALLLVVYDAAAVVVAAIMAVMLRFEHLKADELTTHLGSLPLVLLTFVVIYHAFRLYRYRWQFAGLDMVWSVLLANVLATALSTLWQLHIDHTRLPLSVVVLTCLLATGLVGGQRILLRMLAAYQERRQAPKNRPTWDTEPKRLAILGDGQSAVGVFAALANERIGGYEVVAILDDDPRHHGTFLRGVRILGGLHLLHDLLRRNAIDEVIIALPRASGGQLREFILACCRHKVAVRIVPVIADILENPTALGRLRGHDIAAEDLLHRPTVQMNMQDMQPHLAGKRILVTGAGGSIGSELCRQVSQMDPGFLILLGHGENSIHSIESELRRDYPHLASRMAVIICDIRDTARINQVMAQYRPQVVFHAAAHKHVPMMEENTAEAVMNNVGGTRNVIHAASRHGAERMVLISTDKAVKPSNVMGATKFLCEEMLVAEARRSSTCFIAVRFGNVLGSRGSVLPIFQEQLLRGGPLTITHPEMTRFFMTIPEAVSLVMQAGVSTPSGSLFVLDMGRPVRIVALAEDIIRLSGLEPYRDIGIEFCGLRPGEKLHEELFGEAEERLAGPTERIFMIHRPSMIPADALDEVIDNLLSCASRYDDREVIFRLAELIPAFAEQRGVAISAQQEHLAR